MPISSPAQIRLPLDIPHVDVLTTKQTRDGQFFITVESRKEITEFGWTLLGASITLLNPDICCQPHEILKNYIFEIEMVPIPQKEMVRWRKTSLLID